MNWLLLVVLFIIGIFTYRGYRMGLMRILFSVVAVIITLIISAILTPIVGNMLCSNEQLVNSIEERVVKTLEEKEPEHKNEIQDKAYSKENLERVMEQMAMPEVIKNNILQQSDRAGYAKAVKENVYEHIGHYVAVFILNSAAFIIVYILTHIIISLILNVLNIVSRLPVIHTLNKISGFILGIAQGFIIVWIGCIFINVFSSTEAAQEIFRCIEESPFLQCIYNNNILLELINSITKEFRL